MRPTPHHIEPVAIAIYESHIRGVQASLPGHPDQRSWLQLQRWERDNWRSHACSMMAECTASQGHPRSPFVVQGEEA